MQALESGDKGESAMNSIDSLTLLNVRYHNVTRAQVLDMMEDFIRQAGPHMICMLNADHLVRALVRRRVSPHSWSCGDLVVSDGMGVVYASRWLGHPLKENVGGRLLLPEFAGKGGR